ncbi:DUF3267 domain-containing protein [Natronococcus sp. A-GB7]|uniref:DUF3267 domain-containing protein n=1 Tax=Natronococcus sp. A-GB7 TaxID=3037649 RepID=UPI00241C23C7|nr:DUF3267 domain-containing protein [Natronococcus sp. A-GB7]MDG5818313.1 DUF3267 domain-containing protein [Natronococcus sp. A-GB7]
MNEREEETLLMEFELSRSLVFQWTAVSTLGFVIALIGFLALYYAITGDETAANLPFGLAIDGVWWWSLALSFLTFIVLIALVIVPHELCHGLAIRAFGGEPRYGFGVAYVLFPYAFATSETRLTRDKFIVVALAPLVVLTGIGVPLMLVFEIPWLAIALALNAAGAVGDVWMSLILLSYPASVRVIDKETGLEVYGPPGTTRRETAPATVAWDVLLGFTGGVIITAIGIGVLVPVVLSATGVEAVVAGIPDTPLVLFEFARTNGGANFTVGWGLIVVGAVIGLVYAFTSAQRRSGRDE